MNKLTKVLFLTFLALGTTGLSAANIPLSVAIKRVKTLIAQMQIPMTPELNKTISEYMGVIAEQNQIDEDNIPGIVAQIVTQQVEKDCVQPDAPDEQDEELARALELSRSQTQTPEGQQINLAIAASLASNAAATSDTRRYDLEDHAEPAFASAESDSDSGDESFASAISHKDSNRSQSPDEFFAQFLRDELAQMEADRQLALQLAQEEQAGPAMPSESEKDAVLAQTLHDEQVAQRTEGSDKPVVAKLKQITPEQLRGIVLPSTKQKYGPTCGNYALLNANAIETLVANGKPITAPAIKQLVAQNERTVPKKENKCLENDEITQLSKRDDLEVRHLYFVHVHKERKQVEVFDQKDQVKFIQLAAHLRAQKKTEQACATHIIGNTGGHWVLVSVIFEPNKQPRMIYLDSGNSAGTIPTGTARQIVQAVFSLVYE